MITRIIVAMMYYAFQLSRTAQPKNSEDANRQIFEKGRRIEQEFAEFFTGEKYVLF